MQSRRFWSQMRIWCALIKNRFQRYQNGYFCQSSCSALIIKVRCWDNVFLCMHVAHFHAVCLELLRVLVEVRCRHISRLELNMLPWQLVFFCVRFTSGHLIQNYFASWGASSAHGVGRAQHEGAQGKGASNAGCNRAQDNCRWQMGIAFLWNNCRATKFQQFNLTMHFNVNNYVQAFVRQLIGRSICINVRIGWQEQRYFQRSLLHLVQPSVIQPSSAQASLGYPRPAQFLSSAQPVLPTVWLQNRVCRWFPTWESPQSPWYRKDPSWSWCLR